MADYLAARARMLDDLRRELVGPDPQGDEIDTDEKITLNENTSWLPRRQAGTGEEILTHDGPNRRYGIGVLYTQGSRRTSEEVPTGEGPVEHSGSDDGGPAIASASFTRHVSEAIDGLGEEAESSDLDLSGAGASL